jgi:hypothetical protein
LPVVNRKERINNKKITDLRLMYPVQMSKSGGEVLEQAKKQEECYACRAKRGKSPSKI